MTPQQFITENLTLVGFPKTVFDFVGCLFVGVSIVAAYRWLLHSSKENRTTIE